MKQDFNWWKFAVYMIAILGLLAIGFFTGRKTMKVPEPEVIYVPGDTVSVIVEKPAPVAEDVDTANIIKNCVKNGLFYELFPEKVKDSIVYLTLTKEDTAKVFNDWATRRLYRETLFDIDTLGTASLEAVVQYNRIAQFDYNFTPVIKQVTTVKPKPKYSPFFSAGVTTMPSVSGGIGFFHDDKIGAMFTYQYDYTKKNNVFGSMLLIKF